MIESTCQNDCENILSRLTSDIYDTINDLAKINKCKCMIKTVPYHMLCLMQTIIKHNNLDMIMLIHDDYYDLFGLIDWAQINTYKYMTVEVLSYLYSIKMHRINFNSCIMSSLIQYHRYDTLLWLKDNGFVGYTYDMFDKEMFMWWLDNHMPIYYPYSFFTHIVRIVGFFDSLTLFEEYHLPRPNDEHLLNVLLNYCTLEELIGWYEILDKPDRIKFLINLPHHISNEKIKFCITNFDIRFSPDLLQRVHDIELCEQMLHYAIGKEWKQLVTVNSYVRVLNGNQERDEKIIQLFCEVFNDVPNISMIRNKVEYSSAWFDKMEEKYDKNN